jgi:Ca2+-binding RTX toxin-like protein
MMLETLGKRECFAVSIGGIELDEAIQEKVLVINGTSGADNVKVEWNKKDLLTPYDDELSVYSQHSLVGTRKFYEQVSDTWVTEFAAVKFIGGNGNDSFKLSGETPILFWHQKPESMSVHALGGDGNDRLEGGNGDDLLEGGNGNDVMVGFAGSESRPDLFKGDRIFGGDGNDVIFGDFDISQGQQPPSSYVKVVGGYTYEDKLDGGAGNDSIHAGLSLILDRYDSELPPLSLPTREEKFGVDIAIGGLGNDNLFSDHYAELYGDYDDVQTNLRPDLAKNGGNDFLTTYSQTGSKLVGGAGDDVIRGGWGDDLIYGDSVQVDSGWIKGNDTLFGDPIDVSANTPAGGKDTIYGGHGKDKLTGGGNSDYLDGGVDADHIYGGSDVPNAFTKDLGDVILGGTGGDALYGGLGDDAIFGQDGYDWLYGEQGSDELRGGAEGDHLYGSDGMDALYGDGGADVLAGGEGIDLLMGGDNNDELWGGGDNDILYGQAGNDKLFGLSGDDSLYGGDGNDELSGGKGNDNLYGQAGIDKLWGDAGNDLLDGGAGMVDLLVGGSGKDKFKKDIGGYGLNLDQPVDFNLLDDTIFG